MSKVVGKWIADIAKQEIPSGTVNGVNTSFTLSATPIFASFVLVFSNGVLQIQGTDYTISSTTITMTIAPITDSVISAFYLKR